MGSSRTLHTRLLEKLESIVSIERRYPFIISISNEIDSSLPFSGLPLGCVHEVQSPGLACGIAFTSLLAARIAGPAGQILYVSPHPGVHPPGLLHYGIRPEQWVHVTARSSLDLSWTVLEALRCPQVNAVLAVTKSADLTLCRRWQLAAEGSGATGFLLTDTTSRHSIASAITRWQISSIPAPADATFVEPCWSIDLTYCRGGRPARWVAVWREESLVLSVLPAARPVQQAGLSRANKLAV